MCIRDRPIGAVLLNEKTAEGMGPGSHGSTFGEDPELIEEIFDHLIPGIQGGSNGVTPEGVSMTVKHFPGGGARENGFDPHYAAGQWNIYATPGYLQKYHICLLYTSGMVTRPVTLLCSRLEPAMQANMATMTALDFAEEPSLSVDADRTSI